MSQHPASADAPLAPAAVADLLAALVPALSAEVAALPAGLARWHPRAGEWCVNEVMGHLIDEEREVHARAVPRGAEWIRDSGSGAHAVFLLGNEQGAYQGRRGGESRPPPRDDAAAAVETTVSG